MSTMSHARLSGTNLLFNDIDRIEVLRGPQGTLYGRNNLTGAVKVVRKQADGTTFGSAEGSYGSRDYNDQKATFSTAIAPDKLAVIVSGFHQYKGDYYDAPAIGGKRGKDEHMARVLAWPGSATVRSARRPMYPTPMKRATAPRRSTSPKGSRKPAAPLAPISARSRLPVSTADQCRPDTGL
jgi:outer membrane receptor protein involved in Fe transport